MTLEQLLNKLIKLGWKPFGREELVRYQIDEYGFIDIRAENGEEGYCPTSTSLNDICSIESGLWQFILSEPYEYIKDMTCDNWLVLDEKEYDSEKLEYWIAKSSIQEDKSKFLLDNITIPNE